MSNATTASEDKPSEDSEVVQVLDEYREEFEEIVDENDTEFADLLEQLLEGRDEL